MLEEVFESKMKFLVVLSVLLCSLAQRLNADDASKDASENTLTDFFDVKPGGQTVVYEKEWHKYNCTFTYQAQGGTKEQWQFIFEKVMDGKKLRCTVQRGTTSYLFFENFTMSITGPKVHIEEYDAVSYLEQRLKPEEVQMNKKKRMVHAVKGAFQKKLERVTVTSRIGKKKKDEL